MGADIRIIRKPDFGNAVVGHLDYVNATDGRIRVALWTDEDATACWWQGEIDVAWIGDAMLLIDRKVVVIDRKIYSLREV
jgi:hypothetical protein